MASRQEDPRKLRALESWAEQLACPVCVGALRLEEATVVCTGCGRKYPVVDGIAVLIAERGEKNEITDGPSE